MNIQKIIKTPNFDYLSSLIKTKQSTKLIVPTKDKDIEVSIIYDSSKKYIALTKEYKIGENTNKEELIKNKILPFLLKIYFTKKTNNNSFIGESTEKKETKEEIKSIKNFSQKDDLDLYREELKKNFIMNYNSLKRWTSPKVEVLPIIGWTSIVIWGTLFLSGWLAMLALAGWIIGMVNGINFIEKKQLEKMNNLKKLKEKIF